jgi:hypothetical protein
VDDDDPPARHEYGRSKEADRINLGHWPSSVPAYNNWRLSVVDEVVAASARPDEAFTWIASVRDASLDDLQRANFPYTRNLGFETFGCQAFGSIVQNALRGIR